MEELAYRIKQRFPAAFQLLERTARTVTVLRFGCRLRRAQVQANVSGRVRGEEAVMRALRPADTEVLLGFLESQRAEHLRYFRPHGFHRPTLRRVLASGAFLNYGLFVGERLVGYALLKIVPTGSAFVGRLVARDFAGLGLGTFIARFLYWQASLAGLRARSTISRHNSASLVSHRAVAEFRVVAELPNDYLLIEFPPGSLEAPKLDVG